MWVLIAWDPSLFSTNVARPSLKDPGAGGGEAGGGLRAAAPSPEL